MRFLTDLILTKNTDFFKSINLAQDRIDPSCYLYIIISNNNIYT